MRHFITSDLHFFHTRIIKYAERTDYQETDEDCLRMNQDISSFIDENVPDEDDVILWNLGDVFYGPLINKQSPDWPFFELVNKMRGRHRTLNLVLGNHDKQFKTFWCKLDFGDFWNRQDTWTDESVFKFLGFDNVYQYPIILRNMILSHEPVRLSQDSTFINMHGHTHQMFVDNDYFTWKIENHDMVKKAFKDSDRELPDNFDEKHFEWETRLVDRHKYINACWDASPHHIIEVDL